MGGWAHAGDNEDHMYDVCMEECVVLYGRGLGLIILNYVCICIECVTFIHVPYAWRLKPVTCIFRTKVSNIVSSKHEDCIIPKTVEEGMVVTYDLSECI